MLRRKLDDLDPRAALLERRLDDRRDDRWLSDRSALQTSRSRARQIEARIEAAHAPAQLVSALREAHEAIIDRALSVTGATAVTARGERKSPEVLARIRLRKK